MIKIILGTFLISLITILIMLVKIFRAIKRDWNTEDSPQIISGKTQFLEPITKEEKFKKAKEITDLL